MNKATLLASLTLLPILAYAPLSAAGPESQSTQTEPVADFQLENPLELGETIPNFEIEDPSGGMISLDELLKDGPIVLTFYRGSWCPYCMSELSTVQKRLKKITETGAQVLAISPEIPSETADLVEQKKFGFLFGTDHNNKLAKQLALSFELDAKTIQKYGKYGINVAESNDTEKWELPIPATYVIDTDRTITFAYADEDYSKRADYNKVLKVLRKMADD